MQKKLLIPILVVLVLIVILVVRGCGNKDTSQDDKQNPFTFTKVELIDPETKGTHTTYPMFKTYSVGLNVNF